MAGELIEKKCMPCAIGTTPLKGDMLKPFLLQLGEEWLCVKEHHLEKEFPFKNFKKALEFANVIGGIADEEGHHPNLEVSWGKLKVHIWTHKINGLTESDFILAAKIEAEFISHEG